MEKRREHWRLGLVSTHPIQYHTPWFQSMHADPRIDLKVFYGHKATPRDQSGAGFGVEFEWDIPLLEGYDFQFLENVAGRPGLHFRGIDTPAIRERIRESNFDALLVNGWHYKAAWQAMLAARRNGLPVMVRSDSHLGGGRSWLKRWIKWLPYRVFIPRIDACLCVGSRSREYFEHYGADADRIFTVPHVLAEHWFVDPLSSEAKKVARAKRNLPADPLYPLFVGKLEAIKRPLDFLGALNALPSDEVYGLMVGDGPLRRECEDFASQTGLKIDFLGFVNQAEMPSIYDLADVLVLPSERETWGMVVTEAMARGLPCVVSSAVGAADDLVIEGVTGSTFCSGRVEDLAARLRHVLHNRKLLSDMGQDSRLLIENYRPAAAVEGVIKALKRISRID